MFELIPYDRRQRRAMTYDPFGDIMNMQKAFFGDMPSMSDFRIDVKDNGASFELEADLPGFSKDDIKVEIDDRYLTVKAERKSETDEKDKKGNYVRRERSCGSFTRSFDIKGIDADGITGKYENGVLTLELPKLEEKKPASRSIELM